MFFLSNSNMLNRHCGVGVQLVRIPDCHAGGRGFESRPLRHLFIHRVKSLKELQGCSSNWQSSGFQIRVLGVRISPPLPYLKRPIPKGMGLFAICSLEKISGFPHHKNARVGSSNLSTLAILKKAHIERYGPFYYL